MKLKRFIAIAAVFVMMAAFLCGCDSGAEDPTTTADTAAGGTYTVSFVDQNGNPVANVVVQFQDGNGATQLAVSGADGKVSHEFDTIGNSVFLSSIPEGYSSESTAYALEEKELTIVLTAAESTDNSVSYSVTVVDQNGAPVSDVLLQFCDEENCKLPVATDAEGTVTATYEAANYHITLTQLPEGYTSEETVFYFTDDATEMTIVITEAGE